MKWGSASNRPTATDAKLAELPAHEKEALDNLRHACEGCINELCDKLPECDEWRHLAEESHHTLRDEILLRFLRYNVLNVEKARVQMEEALKWRRTSMVASLSEDVIRGFEVGIPIAQLTDKNKDGEVLYVCISEGYMKQRVDHEKQKVGGGKMFDLILYDVKGPRADRGSIVIDFSNIGVSHIDLTALKNGVVLYLNYFPEVFNKIMFINYPRIIYGVWKAIAPLLDQRTRSRVVWLESGDQMREILSTSYDLNDLPTWMGGKKDDGDINLYNSLSYSSSDLHKRFHQ